MASCPSCHGSRLRAGYRKIAFPLRLLGFRELLCDDCNYLYRAFSPLPPPSGRRKSPSQKADVFMPAEVRTATTNGDTEAVRYKQTPTPPANRQVEKKRVPTSNPIPRTVSPPVPSVNTSNASRSAPARQSPPMSAPIRVDPASNPASSRRSASPVCKHCGTSDTRRRARKPWERAAFAFSSKRPYLCNGCGKSFFVAKKKKIETP